MSPVQLTRLAQGRAKDRIKALGFTPAGFARQEGLPASTVYGWLHREVLSLTTLATMAHHLDMEPGGLIITEDLYQALGQAQEHLDYTGEHWKAAALTTLLKGRERC